MNITFSDNTIRVVHIANNFNAITKKINLYLVQIIVAIGNFYLDKPLVAQAVTLALYKRPARLIEYWQNHVFVIVASG